MARLALALLAFEEGDREETARQLEAAIHGMKPMDREVILLRHFEQLDNKEVAEVLGIQQKAASIRYIRAMARLRDLIADIPGLLQDQQIQNQQDGEQ